MTFLKLQLISLLVTFLRSQITTPEAQIDLSPLVTCLEPLKNPLQKGTKSRRIREESKNQRLWPVSEAHLLSY